MPGSKRYLRTQSLENLSRPPSSKRHGRVSFTSGTTPRPSQRPEGSLEDMSALLTSIKEEELDCAYVVDSVGEVPTSFKSAMESSDAGKWKEACESEFECLSRTRHGSLCLYQVAEKQSAASGFSRSNKLLKDSSSDTRLESLLKVFCRSMASTLKRHLRRLPNSPRFESSSVLRLSGVLFCIKWMSRQRS